MARDQSSLKLLLARYVGGSKLEHDIGKYFFKILYKKIYIDISKKIFGLQKYNCHPQDLFSMVKPSSLNFIISFILSAKNRNRLTGYIGNNEKNFIINIEKE